MRYPQYPEIRRAFLDSLDFGVAESPERQNLEKYGFPYS